MLDYASLAAVSSVVREGTFERAARALNVTPSAISQRVKQLEERLGSVLIIRGQPCAPTDSRRAVVFTFLSSRFSYDFAATGNVVPVV